MIKLHLGDCLELLKGIPDDSISSVVTDPPYGLSAPPDISVVLRAWLAGEKYEHTGSGFMGAAWDSFVPGPRVWREVFRVLKPGGHAVVFAGTRTVDLMGISVRLGGFEVRDCGQWCYWSGFPKSLDLSKSMDKMRHDTDQSFIVTRWLRATMERQGLTSGDINRAFGSENIAQQWLTVKPGAVGPRVPNIDQWERLVALLGAEVPPEVHRLVWELNGRKGEPGAAWFAREVTGSSTNGIAGGTGKHAGSEDAYGYGAAFDITAPATDNARKWAGFGTAVKPAVEPWLLLRKPISESSIARNVLRWGVGGLNIDACRFAPGDSMWPGPQEIEWASHPGVKGNGVVGFQGGGGGYAGVASRSDGRFPANLIHCPKASRAERELGCLEAGLPTKTGAEATGSKEGQKRLDSPRTGAGRTADEIRNYHSTVKPVKLMQWLVRLVTPPGGVVLDPFMGSGTTGMAAVGQGFDFIGMELDPGHLRIARARIAYSAPGHEIDAPTEATAGNAEPNQTRMF